MPDERDLTAIEQQLADVAPDEWKAWPPTESGELLVETTFGHDIHIANMEGSCSLCHQIHEFIGAAPTTIRHCVTEIHRLRAVLAEEQAKTAQLQLDRDHGRAWAEQWRFNAIGDLTSEPTEEPIAAASDGWTVTAPTEEEVNASYRLRDTP